MPAVSKKQQRFFGMVRAAQKGEMENPSSEVLDVASDISMKDAKKFAKTKHKGLPEKKVTKEETKPNPFGKRAILKAMIRSVAERERRKAGVTKEEVKRDEYGDPIGGPKISKKQLKKNLAKNEPDEQHTTATSEGVQASYSSTGEVSYGQFYNRAKEARKAMANKSAKQMDSKKKSDAIRQDSRKHGIKFSDQKGSGRIVKGKKVYN
tara:strand:- start:42 stop:665 length:624 start_codon:yes stop_codon:yes gene_type:complete